MATALATAGLLAGIFGSTLAPVAQAASTINTKLISASLATSTYDDWYYNVNDVSAGATGTAADPIVIYSPYYSDGAADDGSMLDAAVMEVSDSDIEYTNGTDVSDYDDVNVSASATNGLLLQIKYHGQTCSPDFVDYAASKSKDVADNGFMICMATPDDDAAFTSVVTIKVNGVTLPKAINVLVVGPGVAVALTDRTGGWVAMDNDHVAKTVKMAFTDAKGTNLLTWLDGDYFDFNDVVEDYWLKGYESAGYGLEFLKDTVDTGGDFTGDVYQNASYAYADFGSYFCDSGDGDATGDSHTVTAVMDYDYGNTFTSNDQKSTNSLLIKCSADGSEALVTGLDFGTATSVEAGGVTPLYIRIQDGYGNPQGVGPSSALSLDPGMSGWDGDGRPFYYQKDYDYAAGLVPSPAHWVIEPNYDDESWLANDGAWFEYEYDGDKDNICDPGINNEDGDAPTGGDDLFDYLGPTADLAGAGAVRICYHASQIESDLGVNTVKMALAFPYSETLKGIIGKSPVTYKASIKVVQEGSLALGDFVKVGKKTVSVTGRIGSKVTFVVENSAGVTKSYVRVVEADGKAKFVFKVRGTFDVYAMQGESVTPLARITVKL